MNIAICDDDGVFAEKLKQSAEKVFGGLNIKPVISVYNDGESFISDNPECSAVFLDIDMPRVNGFEIAEKINRNGEAFIIFVTSHDELVYSSIKFQPFRFIRKSHLESELFEAVSSLNRAMQKRLAGKKFKLQTKTGEVFLDVDKIEYIETYGHWLRVCVCGGEAQECYGSLKALEERLAPFDFIRTHKSYLVNCGYIRSIEKGRIILDDKTEIPLSRYKVSEVRKKFGNYILSGL